ncbi:uncharacterized protein LOC143235938 [Tachypleus tridentatus]|uniref:uncharacterized protein LOC143235938 n=1 Tax=Tachypleus tridentatus TaxID=6853 RepID=UPI003FD240AC
MNRLGANRIGLQADLSSKQTKAQNPIFVTNYGQWVKPTTEDSPGALCDNFRPLAFYARILGIWPLSNVTSLSVNILHFSWSSFWFIYSAFLVTVMTGSGLFYLYVNLMTMSRCSLIQNLFVILFLGGWRIQAIINMLTLLFSGRKIHAYLQIWSDTHTRLKVSFGKKFFKMAVGFLLYVLAVQILYTGMLIPSSCLLLNGIRCHRDNKNASVFFSPGCFVQPMSMFSWSVAHHLHSISVFLLPDLLIIFFGSTIQHSFTEISRRVRTILQSGKEALEDDLAAVRVCHHQLCTLIKETDKLFSPIILVSCLVNVVHMVILLHRILLPDTSFLEKVVYGVVCLCVPIVRLVALSIQAAKIIDEAMSPLESLHSVATYRLTQSTHDQLRLFISKLNGFNTGLSGSGYFSINRGLLSSLFGAVATYLIVMVQFKDTD